MLGELLVARQAAEEAAVLLGAVGLVEDEVGVHVDFGLVHDLGPLRETLHGLLGAERTVDLAGDGRVIGVQAAVRRAGGFLLGPGDHDGPAGT